MRRSSGTLPTALWGAMDAVRVVGKSTRKTRLVAVVARTGSGGSLLSQ